MNSPFEDLEYLADYLPDEGEAVVVIRRGGELICEPFRQEAWREGISDSELYGRLVQANERLAVLGVLPLWVSTLAAFCLCVAFHHLTKIGWSGWYADLGIGLLALIGFFSWMRHRRRQLFRNEIRPMLETQMRRRELQKFSVIGAIRQHSELSSLLDELVDWTE